MSPDLAALGSSRFVSLTTFRRSGDAVSTPVWVAAEPSGGALLVLTPTGSGKVKRLRHTDRVELRPCGRFGAIPAGARAVPARATIVEDDRPARSAVARKYPIEHRIVLGIERAVERLRRQPPTPRLTLQITD